MYCYVFIVDERALLKTFGNELVCNQLLDDLMTEGNAQKILIAMMYFYMWHCLNESNGHTLSVG